MESEKWICSCGTENAGKFCSACGKIKGADNTTATAANDAIQQAMQFQLQLKQTELAMEDKHRKQQKEHENACKEYDEACAKVPPRVLKKWGRSWIVLLLAILASASAVFTLVSTATGFTGGIIRIIKNMIKLLIAALVCAGFWKAYVECRKPDETFNTGGIGILRGVLTYNKVMMYITMSSITILVILVNIVLMSVTDKLASIIGSIAGADTSAASVSTATVLVMSILAVTVVYVVLATYYKSISKFANQTINCFKNNSAPTQKVTDAAVFFFIIGAFSLVGTIIQLSVKSAVNAIINALLSEVSSIFPSGMGNITSAIGTLFKTDIFATISDFVNAATYIFAGILAVSFNKLGDVIQEEVKAIPQPELN